MHSASGASPAVVALCHTVHEEADEGNFGSEQDRMYHRFRIFEIVSV